MPVTRHGRQPRGNVGEATSPNPHIGERTKWTTRQERDRAKQAELAAQAAADAERVAAEQAARDAAEEAERKALLEAEQKAARDARYAARKAAKKQRRRGY